MEKIKRLLIEKICICLLNNFLILGRLEQTTCLDSFPIFIQPNNPVTAYPSIESTFYKKCHIIKEQKNIIRRFIIVV